MRLTMLLSTCLLSATACSSDVTISGSIEAPLDCVSVDVSTQDNTGLYDHQTVSCGLFGDNAFKVAAPDGAADVQLVLQARSSEHDDADDDVGVVLQLRPLNGDADVGTVNLSGP